MYLKTFQIILSILNDKTKRKNDECSHFLKMSI